MKQLADGLLPVGELRRRAKAIGLNWWNVKHYHYRTGVVSDPVVAVEDGARSWQWRVDRARRRIRMWSVRRPPLP
ncbi:MAG: hypothetical protein J2P48_25155 [Alphaproteobacteria bacterium]|nr:hypothetical protein [Alphaproteobacteria bacterium]